jgi:hypothetical protein
MFPPQLSPSRTIVIDTKYDKDTLQTNMEHDSVRSGRICQLLADPRNTALLESKPDEQVEGMLLYPTVDTALDLEYPNSTGTGCGSPPSIRHSRGGPFMSACCPWSRREFAQRTVMIAGP